MELLIVSLAAAIDGWASGSATWARPCDAWHRGRRQSAQANSEDAPASTSHLAILPLPSIFRDLIARSRPSAIMPAIRNQSAPRAQRYASRPDRVLPQAEMQRDEAGDVIEEDDDDVDRDAQGARDDDDDEGDDDDDTGPGPSNEPEDQPLASGASMNIKHVANDWKSYGNVMDSVRQNIKEVTQDYAAIFARIGSKGEAMDKRFRAAIDANHEATIREEAMRSIAEAVAKQEAVYDAVEMYNKKVEEELEKYRKKTTRQKYLHHDEYRSFKESVWEVYNDDAMPPLGDFIEREEGDEDDDDDEIDAGSVRQEYK